MTYRVLDLFCCEGGASKGYEQAGLELLAAIDIDMRRVKNHYAYKEGRGPVYRRDWREGLDEFGQGADLIHASPPCQFYSTQTPETTRANWRDRDLVRAVRAALKATGKPYVIENVPQAPLEDPIYLDGSMFPELVVDWDPFEDADHRAKVERNSHEWNGVDVPCKHQFLDARRGLVLCCRVHNDRVHKDGTPVRYWNTKRNGQEERVRPMDNPANNRWRIERKRGFEISGFTVVPPQKLPEMLERNVMTITTSSNPTAIWNKLNRRGIPIEVRHKVMGGVGWMSGVGVGESIPPAYTKYIGEAFIASRDGYWRDELVA